MMISMSVVHSLSISSLRCITNSVHYGWFKTWIYSTVYAISSNHLFHESFENFLLIVPGKSLNYLFHDDFVVCFIFCKFQRCTTRIAFSPYLVTEIWFCQNLLGKDITRCLMIISMCVVHSLSISSLRPKGNLSITSHSKTAFRNSFGKQLKSLVSW